MRKDGIAWCDKCSHLCLFSGLTFGIETTLAFPEDSFLGKSLFMSCIFLLSFICVLFFFFFFFKSRILSFVCFEHHQSAASNVESCETKGHSFLGRLFRWTAFPDFHGLCDFLLHLHTRAAEAPQMGRKQTVVFCSDHHLWIHHFQTHCAASVQRAGTSHVSHSRAHCTRGSARCASRKVGSATLCGPSCGAQRHRCGVSGTGGCFFLRSEQRTHIISRNQNVFHSDCH